MPIPPGFSRETALRRDDRGRWFDGATPIDNESIERAFDRWIDRADDGRYCLRNEINWAYVSIEGAPIDVRRAEPNGNGVRVSLSDGHEEPLDFDTLRQAEDLRLYCQVRAGSMPARFSRQAIYDLSDLVDEHNGVVLLRFGGREYVVPTVQDPLVWPG